MTGLYFVRHAQPDYRTGTDRTFSLSEEGMSDRLKALEEVEVLKATDISGESDSDIIILETEND